jgi:hypothetical protein
MVVKTHKRKHARKQNRQSRRSMKGGGYDPVYSSDMEEPTPERYAAFQEKFKKTIQLHEAAKLKQAEARLKQEEADRAYAEYEKEMRKTDMFWGMTTDEAMKYM